ncbi:glycerophosphodiester phosphodiesterase domain-containing protein 5 [Aplysia californica]|uniref:Glycerophosphodiester phosphodiesterase domain-containing protein 5 n=1 Tax=Aplysia californica TaxID=6500 RepID=A0ABM1W1Y7_APLCA|nr:glycerophosphodiester phosphodiesterase domain-containing protein 5 [Aplysia californica]
MTSIFWLLCRQWFKLRTYAIKCVWLLLFVLLMLGLYLSPLAVDSPLIRSETPPKPNIVALGGAVQVAPENTLMAFQKALDMGVNKLHTTVQISADGVPFLFGDDTLERTTNAESLLPGNASLDPMRHTWVNLTSLDAGSWFLEADPWDTADSLKQQDKDLVSKQGLLSLEDFLQFLSSQPRPSDDMTVFLHYRPLDRHHQGFKDINVAGPHVTDRGAGFIINPVINASALDLKVFATPVTSDRLKGVQGLLETPLSSAVASLVSQSDVAMLELGDVSIEHIRELQRANVSVGVQEVNSEWLLSLLWCVGVEYVATHDIGVLLALGSPVWRMSKGGYLAMWISVDLFSVIVILVMFIVQRVQLYGTNFSPESISLNTGRARTSYRSRTMKEKLLREGGIIEAVDDMEGSNAGAQDADGGVINEPVYCMTSGHQAYSLTSLSAIRVEDGGHSGVVVQAASAAPQPS